MRPHELVLVQQRLAEIVSAVAAAGIPPDELSAAAFVMGGQLLTDRYLRHNTRRPIGFAPPTRKDDPCQD